MLTHVGHGEWEAATAIGGESVSLAAGLLTALASAASQADGTYRSASCRDRAEGCTISHGGKQLSMMGMSRLQQLWPVGWAC